MKQNQSSNHSFYLMNIMQEISEKIKSNALETKNNIFECQYIEKMFLDSDQIFLKKNFVKIINKSPYFPAEKADYKKLKTIQNTLKQIKTDQIGKIIRLAPKLDIGDLYVPLKAFSIETDKEEEIVNQKQGITIITIWSEDIIETYSGIKQMLCCIEKNKEFHIKENIQYFALHQKSEYFNTKDFIKEKNLNKYPELLKHFFF